jgi:hypothetical protein
MTNVISNNSFFIETISILTKNLTNLQALSSRIFSTLIVILMLTLSILAVISFASSNQKLEADVGLRHKNVSVKQVQFFNKIKEALLDPTKASAFSLNPLDGIGEIIGNVLKTVAEPIFNIILGLIKNIILPMIEAVVKPILSLLNGILDTINGFLGVIDGLAANISATRVGIGFKVYRDIEGLGEGSSNFESSTNFTKRLLSLGGVTTQTVFNSAFPKKDEIKSLIADTIAWGDFMTVQKSLQSNIIGDFATAALSLTGVVNFDQVNENVTSIVIGKQCENSNAISVKTPIFNQLIGSTPPPCVAENRGAILQQLKGRQQAIFSSTLEKSKQYETQLPADCKYGQYFDIGEGATVEYDENNPGDLALKLSTFSTALTIKTITAAECQALKSGKQDHTKIISDLLSPANITAAFGAGIPITTLLNDILNKSTKDLFSSLTAKFNKALEIIKSIANQSAVKSGLGLYGALSLVIQLKDKINSRLDTLNKEYEEFRAGSLQSLATDTVNELKITEDYAV